MYYQSKYNQRWGKTTELQKAVFALNVVMRQNGRWNGSMNEKSHLKGVTIWWLLGNNNRQYYLYMFSGYIADDIVISIIPIYAWKNAYHQMKISQRTSLGLPQWLVSCKRLTFTTSWFFYVNESFIWIVSYKEAMKSNVSTKLFRFPQEYLYI